MFQTSCGILYQNQDVKVGVRGVFDGLRAYEQLEEILSDSENIERLVLDFSTASHVRVVELYYFISQLVADSRFAKVKLCLEELQGKTMR